MRERQQNRWAPAMNPQNRKIFLDTHPDLTNSQNRTIPPQRFGRKRRRSPLPTVGGDRLTKRYNNDAVKLIHRKQKTSLCHPFKEVGCVHTRKQSEFPVDFDMYQHLNKDFKKYFDIYFGGV